MVQPSVETRLLKTVSATHRRFVLTFETTPTERPTTIETLGYRRTKTSIICIQNEAFEKPRMKSFHTVPGRKNLKVAKR